MFSFRQTLHDLKPADVGNLDKAIANAEAFALEVIKLLRKAKPAVTVAEAKEPTDMTRINPFGDLSDLSGGTANEPKPVETAGIERIARENGFPSRQASIAPAEPAKPRRRRYTTGRNQQLNVKATAETIARFYRLADDRGCPLGELLEQALSALEGQRLPS